MSDTATQWREAAATVLDVRPDLERGDEPFVRIMEAAVNTPAGQSLVIIAPFEPVPLYSALSGRGFSHATERVSETEWVVRFTHEER